MTGVVSTDFSFDRSRLQEELAVVRSIFDFEQGRWGNIISLPSEGQLPEPFAGHHNNLPYSGTLRHCPYLAEIFDLFRTVKAAFRLLRRPGQSGYAFHDDKDKGVRVIRLQIPIITSQRAWLVIPRPDADLGFFEARHFDAYADASSDIWFDLNALYEACDGKVDLFELKAGRLAFFDTDQIHTLINTDPDDRITLAIDLVLNDWLEDWMRTNLNEEVAPLADWRSHPARWKWNALRNGVIRTAA